MIFYASLAACYAIAFFLLTKKVVDKRVSILYSALFGIVHSYGFSRVLAVIALLIIWGAFGAGTQGHGTVTNMPFLLAVCAAILTGLEQLWIMVSLTFSKIPVVVKHGVIFRYAIVLALCDMAIGSAWLPTTDFRDRRLQERNGLGMTAEDDRVGFIDRTGKIVIPAKYILAGDFKDGLAMVVEPNNPQERADEQALTPTGMQCPRNLRKCSFIDKEARKVLDGIETTADHFSDGLLPAFDEKTKHFGYIDRMGKQILPPNYAQANNFEEGLATVALPEGTSRNVWACIDKRGKVLWTLTNVYDMTAFSGGIARVIPAPGDANNRYFVDRKGKTISAAELLVSNARLFEAPADGMNSNQAIIDSIEVGPEKFALPYSEELSLLENVHEGNSDAARWMFVDKEMKSAFANQSFSEARSFKEGRATVKGADGEWWFIDRRGQPLNQEHFRTANSFSEGLASFSKDSSSEKPADKRDSGKPLFGFIDSSGQIKIEPKFKYVRSFSEGLAAVQID